MPQKTNLNISPYYDDFDKYKNFYRVLFKPGHPVQARELTALQSSLQNQVESFGSHIFKEGSMVIPGNINVDVNYSAVKLNSDHLGVDISIYGSYLVGKRLRGQDSEVVAIVTRYENISESAGFTDPTVFVKYIRSGTANEVVPFTDGETLIIESSFTYGNTTISAEDTVATLISENATSVGSAASVGQGVFFIRGTFVDVETNNIVLDPYTNTPSYRIGLTISEEIISAKDDASLYDNAKGFSNYAAPGADRLKISTILSKKLLTDYDDKSFVELVRIDNGVIKKLQDKTQYSLIKDYFAKRTYEESGNYTVGRYDIDVKETLNDRKGNNGVFVAEQQTDDRNTPSDDLMAVTVSPGKAYVRGYDIESVGTTVLDVNKPRTTDPTTTSNIPFEFGTLVRLNNVNGTPWLRVGANNIVDLHNDRKNSVNAANGTKIGEAKVYSFSLSDDSYEDAGTEWDLYVYDVQTYTNIIVNTALSNTELPANSRIRGRSSGATGFAVAQGGGGTSVNITQTSGTFLNGEAITINEDETGPSRTIRAVTIFSSKDIKSVFQNAPGLDNTIKQVFVGDTVLKSTRIQGFSLTDDITIAATTGVTRCNGKKWAGKVEVGDIISYQRSDKTVPTFNKITAIASDGNTITVDDTPADVSNVCDKDSDLAYTGTFSLLRPVIEEKGGLYGVISRRLPVASINVSTANLAVTQQITGEETDTSTGNMSIPSTSIIGIQNAFFEPYDAERYSVFYNNDTIEQLSSDQVVLANNGLTVNLNGMLKNQTVAGGTQVTVNTTVTKQGLTSKKKDYIRSTKVTIDKCVSAASTITSGLDQNQFYGLRVEDEDICLNYPDPVNVIGVFEALDTNNVITLDSLEFPAGLGLADNAILGETIIGTDTGALAQITDRTSNTKMEVVYLNTQRFDVGELVTFQESNITTTVAAVNDGVYSNVTSKFKLDKGQKQSYYDYGKLVRRDDGYKPTFKLIAVFNRYDVPANDTGDLYTIASYDSERFKSDIPIVPISNIERDTTEYTERQGGHRATNLLDFRPRVPVFSSTTTSPFAPSSRNFATAGMNPNLIVAPNEASLISFKYYLERNDRLVLNKQGKFNVIEGNPAINATTPVNEEEAMDIAILEVPAYVFDTDNVKITMVDNKRYTMRDIGKLEDRIENLETVTSLTMLELDTKTLQVRDADGLDRYKSGFFVDDYKDDQRFDASSKVNVNTDTNELETPTDFESFKPELGLDPSINASTADFSADLPLLDSNTQKTGDLLTLSYTEKEWINQPLASRVENVNPFNMIEWVGIIKLSPASDNWVRSIYVNGGQREIWGDRNDEFIETTKIGSRPDKYIRSRNVKFRSWGLQPYTRYYPFFESTSGIDVVPKLVEITMNSGTFQVDETVLGFHPSRYGGTHQMFTARLAQPGHKSGNINNPSTTYGKNPYDRSITLGTSYSGSSTVLNIDINALSDEALGRWSGYVVKGMKIVGTTSKAEATVTDVRLINDNWGDLEGSFFFRNPNKTNPAPPLRWTTGTKTFRLTNSSTNSDPLPGSLLISRADVTYRTSGIVDTYRQTLVIVRIPPPPPEPSCDPLAQSFTVDESGAFLTAVDLFFGHKDDTENVRVEIRTVELGTPTSTVVADFAQVILTPDLIKTSRDGSVPTKVTFPSPVYLQPETEYAVVILAPSSNFYEAWIAQMGEKTVGTSDLPDDENVIVTKQYTGGSLFKSQNGTIWTPNQFQDLKFKLYKAQFKTQGTVTFYNPPLNAADAEVMNLNNNSITTLPRKLKVTIGSVTNGTRIGELSIGSKVSDGLTPTDSYGYIEGVGGAPNNVVPTLAGIGYSAGTFAGVETYNITGSGSGLTLNGCTFGTGTLAHVHLITVPTVATAGTGYKIGDVVGIKTSSVVKGGGTQITVTTLSNRDTLYLTNVQGDSLANGDVHLNDAAWNASGSSDITGSTVNGTYNTGNYIDIRQYNHGMHSGTDIVTISGAEPNTTPTTTSAIVNASDGTISVASTVGFNYFDGKFGTFGYAKVNNEVIFYDSITSGTGNAGTLGIGTRGIDGTTPRTHELNSTIRKYELNGMNLQRINTTHSSTSVKDARMDDYKLLISRVGSHNQVSFNNQNSVGGETIYASRNFQFSSINPRMVVMTPGEFTSMKGRIRTVSGRSAGGSETPFLDQGFQPVEIDSLNTLTSPRIVASAPNEDNYLTALPRNKSFTYQVDLSSADPNLSPVIDYDNVVIITGRSRLNNPVSDYASDGRVNELTNDPHSGLYSTKRVDLKQPATSIKVLVSSYRHETADFRVLYQLFRPDSGEIEQKWELFPGWDNMVDTNGDGFGDVGIGGTHLVGGIRNNGKPDAKVVASSEGEFKEYRFSADGLDEFTGFKVKIVMSGTNEAFAPKFKDLRVIALA